MKQYLYRGVTYWLGQDNDGDWLFVIPLNGVFGQLWMKTETEAIARAERFINHIHHDSCQIFISQVIHD